MENYSFKKKTVCSLLHQLNVSGCWLFLDNESVIIDNIFINATPNRIDISEYRRTNKNLNSNEIKTLNTYREVYTLLVY